jgi:hypothetical protein
MRSAVEQFSSFVALARQRHAKHIRFSLLVGLLIAALLWQTQWITLRPALFLLLIGQFGTAAILFNRRAALSKRLDLDKAGMLAWFDTEEGFVKYLTAFENGIRTVGLMVLAYGFWLPTRNLGVALALGVVYPIIAYFGLVRGNLARTIRQLRMQKSELDELFNSQ